MNFNNSCCVSVEEIKHFALDLDPLEHSHILCVSNFARHVILIDCWLLQEHVQTPFVLS